MKLTQEQIAALRAVGIEVDNGELDEGYLDEFVHDLKAGEAAAINNQGPEAQIACLTGDYSDVVPLILVDLYGDRENIRVFEASPELEGAIQEWVDLDNTFTDGDLDEDQWAPFTEFMEKRGYTPRKLRWRCL